MTDVRARRRISGDYHRQCLAKNPDGYCGMACCGVTGGEEVAIDVCTGMPPVATRSATRPSWARDARARANRLASASLMPRALRCRNIDHRVDHRHDRAQ